MGFKKFLKRFPIFQSPDYNWKFLFGDLFLMTAAVFGSFAIRLEWSPLIGIYLPQSLRMLAIALLIKPIVYYFGGLYRRQWTNKRFRDLLALVVAVTASSIGLTAAVCIMTFVQSRMPDYIGFPRTTLIIDWLLSLIFIYVSRFSFKLIIKNQSNRSSHPIKINSRWFTTIVIALCLTGFSLRLYFYGINRSLWADEASLALNLVNRSFLGLFKPLDYGQGAPIGFLLIQKTIISLLGSKDYILRILPLLAGLVSVPLMYSVAKQYLGQFPTLISLGMFALSPRLVYYSSELKQYSTDVLVTLFLLFMAPICMEDKVKTRTLIGLGIAGSITLWISHPSLFVFLGILLTLGLSFAIKGDRRRLTWLIGIGGIWTINLGILYFISLRSLESNSYLINYWNGAFAPIPPWNNFSWYTSHLGAMLRDPASLPINAITVGLFIFGIYSFILRRWQLFLVLLSPLVFTIFASMLERYPFAGRLLLFLIPLLLLILAEGVERTRTLLLRMNKTVAGFVSAALVIYLLYGWVLGTYENLQSPSKKEDIKPVMAYISENYFSNDQIYVYHGARTAFEFYAPDYGFDRETYILGIAAQKDPTQFLSDIDNIQGSQRIWVVFSHNCPRCVVNEKEFILEYFDEIGQEMSEFSTDDASAHLYIRRPIP
jgi:hypothetical protein